MTASGYLAIEPYDNEGSGRKLIPISVTPDRAPSVTVDAPGRDLLLADASQPIPIRATAADDLGLRSLELRCTKVSGTGSSSSSSSEIASHHDRAQQRDEVGRGRRARAGGAANGIG